MIDHYRISVRRSCRLASLSHSVWYYKPHPRDDRLLGQRIRQIAEVRVRYGFWRVFILLRREGFTDNHERVYRIYKEEGLNLRSKPPRRNRSCSHRLDRPVLCKINQCWRMDFVADQLFDGRRFRVVMWSASWTN